MDSERAYELLRGVECPACGGGKQVRQSFCRECYFRLPREMRNALYRRLGAGYTQAFNRALAWLASNRHAA